MDEKMKPKIYYDRESDSAYIYTQKGTEEEFIELADGINLELDKNKDIIGIEILNASSVLMPLMRSIPSEKIQKSPVPTPS